MAVLEGLACGVPIISSDVGWAHEYPHIPFENNDAASLRRVLAGLVDQRRALRAPVLERSWTTWADRHLELFDRLISQDTTSVAVPLRVRSVSGVTLITHGQESVTLGGPSVRVPKTAASLARLGVDAVTPTASDNNDDANPIAHIFNVWPAASCHTALKRARASGKKTVLSPIYLNLSNVPLSSQVIPQLFQENRGDLHVDRVLQEISKQVDAEPNLPLREPYDGYHALVRSCVALSDGAIYLSDYERRCLDHIGAVPKASRLVRNPVDVSRFAHADPSLFTDRFGLDGYILCVGRIEHRKINWSLPTRQRHLENRLSLSGMLETPPMRSSFAMLPGVSVPSYRGSNLETRFCNPPLQVRRCSACRAGRRAHPWPPLRPLPVACRWC